MEKGHHRGENPANRRVIGIGCFISGTHTLEACDRREPGVHSITVTKADLPGRDRGPPLGAVTGCEQSQQSSPLFNHLVGACQQRRRHVDAERLGGLHIDDQLVLGRRLHRKIGGLFALEDAIDVAGGEAIPSGASATNSAAYLRSRRP
jgi:hypothetical protein